MPVRSAKPAPPRSPRTGNRRTSPQQSQTGGRTLHATRGHLALRCRRKFLRYYPKGFVDADYLDLERGYKWTAHKRWSSDLGKDEFEGLLHAPEFACQSKK